MSRAGRMSSRVHRLERVGAFKPVVKIHFDLIRGGQSKGPVLPSCWHAEGARNVGTSIRVTSNQLTILGKEFSRRRHPPCNGEIGLRCTRRFKRGGYRCKVIKFKNRGRRGLEPVPLASCFGAMSLLQAQCPYYGSRSGASVISGKQYQGAR